MSKVIRDPKGNELRLMLLQVLNTDDQGPVILRVRRDDEKIALAETPAEQRRFLMVWAPVGSDLLTDDSISTYLRDLDALKDQVAGFFAERAQHERDLANARERYAELADVDRAKTEELRKLQRERDPERVAKAIAEAVTDATAAQTALVASLRGEVQTRDNEIRELKESKRRLKEANERLKKELAK